MQPPTYGHRYLRDLSSAPHGEVKKPAAPLRLTADRNLRRFRGDPPPEGAAFVRRGLARFRVLVEVLLGTGARISEALSLKRSSIDFRTGEATIIGKGNKERVLFFSPRALNSVKEYVTRRKDEGGALFVVGRRGRPMRLQAALVRFRRFRRMIRFPKPVTAHMLRHTVATTLLFNGCPIGHIKDILGHDRLITTCNFYLGRGQTGGEEGARGFSGL